MFKIHTLSGYDEVGKNMTAVEFGDDIFVFDCGLYLPAVIDLQESTKQPTPALLRGVGALPNDDFLFKQKEKVRAFLITHAHLDHVGAIPYIVQRYPNAEIFATPFTIEVLKTLARDSNTNIKNKINIVQPDSSRILQGRNRSYTADFVHISH